MFYNHKDNSFYMCFINVNNFKPINKEIKKSIIFQLVKKNVILLYSLPVVYKYVSFNPNFSKINQGQTQQGDWTLST
jgi:hypothetical protein